MTGPIIRNYDKTVYKKCIKCRGWKPREDIIDEETQEVSIKRGFGRHPDSSDSLQSICLLCKNVMNVVARKRNVTQRIRHHTGTRCLTQLGDLAPKGLVANLEDYLGYKILSLVRHLSRELKNHESCKRTLKDALNEGYHIDHIKPLSSFPVIRDGAVDWGVFRECWAPTNLRAIPAGENLAKGATYDDKS